MTKNRTALGENGLGAIGSAASYITVLSSLFWGFSSGGSVLVGMLFGKKDFVKLKSIIITTFIILFGIALVICPLSVIFKKEIFDFLKVDPALRSDGYLYFTPYVSGLFFMVLTNFCVQIFNALGESSFPLKMAALSALLNISGNILTVAVLDIGVVGIALSSVISAVAVDTVFAIRLISIFRKINNVDLCRHKSPIIFPPASPAPRAS